MNGWPVVAVVLLVAALYGRADTGDYDFIIRNATLIDGSGDPAVRADVALTGQRITAISREPLQGRSARVIDASNLVLSPGFIDMHSHLDPILKLPEAQSAVSQGITTGLGGPDGSAPWPLKPHLDQVERNGTGINICMLVGHNSVRQAVMGLEDRAPARAQMSRMKEMIAQAMDEGAWGLSTGLKYLPGAFSKTDEVIELSRVVATRGGFYTSHIREEGLGLIDAVQETIEIGRQAGIPVVITHHKIVGKPMWGKSSITLAMVDAARSEGIDVMMDQYPYTATYAGITILVPAWARAGGMTALWQRLQNPELRARIRKEIAFNILNDRGGGDLRRVQFGRVKWRPELEGKTLYDLALEKGLEPNDTNGAELIIWVIQSGGASAIFHVLHEGDVERIMRHPFTMVGSDGRLSESGVGRPHPRWYGAFPRILGRYVREKKTLLLEEAIRKMTSLSASRIGLKKRGLIREGYYADLVLFDPRTIHDKATFQNPHQYPEGIHYVFVNGKPAIDKGKFMNRRAGQVLRRSHFSENPVFPGEEWSRCENPEAAGWSSARLREARVWSGQLKTAAVMIVQGGRIIDEWGQTARPFKCHSMRKSILSALYGPHVFSGRINLSRDMTALGIDDNEPSLTSTEKKATIADLIKARSGIYHPALYETATMAASRPKRHSHDPGAFWYYNNWDFNALCSVFENLTGRSIFEEFEDHLAGPLGMQDFDRNQHAQYVTGDDSVHPAYPFQLSARDLARLGLLFSRGGRWKNQQIIPLGWTMESTRSHSTTPKKGGYGYMWWVATDDFHLPHAVLPAGAFSARGYRGHRVLVVPQWDLIIVHRVNTFTQDDRVDSAQFGQLVQRILRAMPGEASRSSDTTQ